MKKIIMDTPLAIEYTSEKFEAILRYVHRRVDSIIEAEEIADKAITRFEEKVAKSPGDKKEFINPMGYIYRTARNLINDYYKQKPFLPINESNLGIDINSLLNNVIEHEEVIKTSEILLLLDEAIDNLPEREKIIVQSRYYEGLSKTKIAEQLGVSEEYCRRLNILAISQLRDFMNHRLK